MFLIINRYDLTNLLRYIRPRNLQIYQQAFIHRSALKKIQRQCDTYFAQSNERLEFLGDSVLNLIVTSYLYNRFPHENEGFLTKLRIKLVKGSTLAWFAKKIGLESYIVLSNSTVLNNNILENTFEALLGAIFLDYCYTGCEMFYITLFLHSLFDEFVEWDQILKDDNYKDILMRHLQKIHMPMPQYKIENTFGKAHCPIYKVTLIIDNTLSSTNKASSKREAEQACGMNILEQMNVPLTSIT
jgi:ribonuclease-3